jgi:hypothetical protein
VSICTAYETDLGFKTNCPQLHGITDLLGKPLLVELLLSNIAHVLGTHQKWCPAQRK